MAYGLLNPVWHRMLYSCNHMATVGVKGLRLIFIIMCCINWCSLTSYPVLRWPRLSVLSVTVVNIVWFLFGTATS